MKKTYIIPVSRPIALRDNISINVASPNASISNRPSDAEDKMEDDEGNMWHGL